jgi:hypothetical protein
MQLSDRSLPGKARAAVRPVLRRLEDGFQSLPIA